MKAVLYIRIAYDYEAEERQKFQEKLMRMYADANQMQIGGVFRDIGNGSSEDRPGLADLLAALSRNRYDGVLVRNLEQIGRGVLPTLKTVDKIERTGAKVISMDGGHLSIDSTRQMMRELVCQYAKQRRSK